MMLSVSAPFNARQIHGKTQKQNRQVRRKESRGFNEGTGDDMLHFQNIE